MGNFEELKTFSFSQISCDSSTIDREYKRSSKSRRFMEEVDAVLRDFNDNKSDDDEAEDVLYELLRTPIHAFQNINMDDIVAKEFSRLSMKDREQALNDIHGVSGEVDETKEFVEDKLREFERELSELTRSKCGAYHIALSLDNDYVCNEAFRLRFLRADRFDVALAVDRFVRHFETKLELFGPELLARDIVQDDLTEEDRMAIVEETLFEMPVRDMRGRMVLMKCTPPMIGKSSIRAIERGFFYFGMTMTEDEETQRKGYVVVTYNIGQHLNWQYMSHRRSISSRWGTILSIMPLRTDAFHLCSDSIVWKPLFAMFKFGLSMSTGFRARVREHIGSLKEILFNLQTYGISTQHYPVLEGGYEAMQRLTAERFEKRSILEQEKARKFLNQQEGIGRTHPSSSQSLQIGIPGQNDVLLGRGKACYGHTGNLRFRSLVCEMANIYDHAGFAGKQKVSVDIVKTIHSREGRFLKDDGFGWVEVDNETAEKKVSHAFRTLRRSNLKKKTAETQKDEDTEIRKRSRMG